MNHFHLLYACQRFLFALWILTFMGCYEKLTLPEVKEDFCRPGDPSCASLDFDNDGVSNGIDSFPLDHRCAERNQQNCSACGKGCADNQQCTNEGKCIDLALESCNGLDDDLNGVIDDLSSMVVPLADLQQGVCQGLTKQCQGSNGWQNPNYIERVEHYQMEEAQCDGIDNDCDGAIDEKLALPLANNQNGVCQGMNKLCTMAGYQEPALSLAANYEREDQSCDGQDNDCDGKTDESYQSEACQSPSFGICILGNTACIAGQIECQSIERPVAELCDDIDNDCDGNIDENVKNACGRCGAVPQELCDTIDNDCDGRIDEGLNSTAESCDGLDNDCDGGIDEALNAPLASVQHGICVGLKKQCQGMRGYIEPEIEALGLFEQNDEHCDGLDNDCDGKIDEDYQSIRCESAGFGICKMGQSICQQGQVQCKSNEQGISELCDGLDNDCNGLIDDQLIGYQSSKQNGICVGSKTICQGGHFIDPDYSAIAYYEANEQSCDGLDNDCDGKIDEQLNPPFDENQNGVCLGTKKRCLGASGYVRVSNQDIQGYEEQEQSCDGLDNDCDGKIDENVKNACGTCGLVPIETCDIIDNDCDGKIDESLESIQENCDGVDNDCDHRIDENLILKPVLKNQGICQIARQQCQGKMGWIEPNYTLIANYQAVEMQCDGLDNDCDGIIDETVTEVLADLQDGVCIGSLKLCYLELGYIEPDYTELHAYQANESLCDGLDNDCDALVDETLLNACGTCGIAPRELCDSIDNDCDHKIDEGTKNACGSCGIVPRELCDSIDNDCDGKVDEAVKNACGTCGSPPIEICDLLDNDCDGVIDENVKNACGLCDYLPVEQCDLLDNDCDGKLDEGVRNACGTCGDVPLEQCDQRDNDCDGKTDEGVKNACDLCGVLPTEICDGYDNDCDLHTDENLLNACGRCGPVPVESCDGSDNDCDGFFDENLVMNLADKQAGVCVGQKKLCQGVLRIQEPNYSLIQGYEASEVTCDGLDNDCDSKLDEVFIPDANLKVGVCLGMKKECQGALGIVEPNYATKIASYETIEASCDHLDNDCDGRQDEGLQNCCGDGVVQSLAGEQCDDGNLVNTDGCRNDCSGRCGDGIVNGGEQCDDGNTLSNDNCSATCQFPCGANCPNITFITIQSGSFNMGSNTNTDEQPIHNVQIRSNFYVGKTEVTVGQYRACVNAGQCTAPNDTASNSSCNWTASVGAKETHPVNCVDWNQARAFARWMGGDLLTEAQWEYVATAQGQAITYPWGNAAPTCQLANFYNNAYCVGSTAPVCNTTGGNTAQAVCDMGGNVWEWVLDEYHSSYSGAPVNEQAWCSDIGVCNTNTSANRVFRGGSWNRDASFLRSADRTSDSPGARYFNLGFRVSRSVP